MDDIHKKRINSNIIDLLERTNNAALVHYFELRDKKEVIPDKLLTIWKDRIFRDRLDNYRANLSLYEEIQKRGPEAFQLLLDCLQGSGQQDLAILLEPSLSMQDPPEVEPKEEKPFYDESGINVFIIDDPSTDINPDALAFRAFLSGQGHKESKNFDELSSLENLASLVVVSFSLWNPSDQKIHGSKREDELIHSNFTKAALSGKPKILISFRYNIQIPKVPQRIVEYDTAPPRIPYKDIYVLRIYLNEPKKTGNVSQGVEAVILKLSEKNGHFLEHLLDLNKIFKSKNLGAIEEQSIGFSKRFQFCKNSQ